MENKILQDETINEVYKLPCRMCDIETNHIVLKSVKNRWSEEIAEVQGFENFEIVMCKGCDQMSFRSTAGCSEDYFFDEMEGPIYPEHEQLFPSRIAGRKHLRDIYYLPAEIQKIYTETHGALCSKFNVLSGAGVRILIESVCKENNAKGNNLERRIDDLVTKGILTKQEALTLHSTRILGNRTVHEIIAPKDIELDVAMDIVENLIKTVYIIPKKAEKLKK